MKVTMFVRQLLTDVVDSSPQHSTLRILRSTLRIYIQRHSCTSTPRIYIQRHASTLNATHLHSTHSHLRSTLRSLRHNVTTMNEFTPTGHHNYVTTTTSPRTPTRLLVSSCMLHTRYSMYNTHRTMLSLALVLSDLCRASRISICASCTHTFALVA